MANGRKGAGKGGGGRGRDETGAERMAVVGRLHREVLGLSNGFCKVAIRTSNSKGLFM